MNVNIIIVNDFAHINGGASKVAINTAILLKDRNYNITYFTAVPPVDESLNRSKINTIITEQKDILQNQNRLDAAIYGLWNRKAEKIFSKLLCSFDPEVTIIHIHSWTKALSPSIFRPVINGNFKIIITVNDYFLFCPNGGFFDYKREKICNDIPMSLECIRKNCDSRAFSHKLWRTLRQLIQNKTLKNAWNTLHLIAPSDFTKTIIKNHLRNIPSIHIMGNPIFISKKVPVKAHINNAFVYVGRLSSEKGVLLFAKAARELGINALFIGDGYLKEEILRIYPEALITGWVKNDELENLLKSARILVYPSLCPETQGLAVLEAKAMGIPSIVSDCCAAREYVIDGVDSFLFRGGNLKDLIDKISLSLNDSLIEKMSNKAYENYWANPFTADKYVDSLELIYKSIIEA